MSNHQTVSPLAVDGVEPGPSERNYRELYDQAPAMLFTLDTHGRILSVNKFGAECMGYGVAELVGQSLSILLAEQERKDMRDRLAACIRRPETIHRWEVCKLRKNGQPLWVRESVRVVNAADGHCTLLVVCEDISETHYLARQLSHQASHDDLTGLVNRREFERRLRRVLKTAREDHSEHALCYLDLDQFKVINDACGHVAGDELLRQLGGLLQKQARHRDTLARLGGDEFGILMEHCSPQQARRLADEIRKAIEGFRFRWDNEHFHIGASIGLVPINAASADMSSIMSAADSACYVAKEAGRNRVHEYNQMDTMMVRRDSEIRRVVQIDRALQENRLTLYYQPILPLAVGESEGAHYELLLRMHGHEGDMVTLGNLLPTAERFNLASKLDRWVLETALGWLAAHPGQLKRTFRCAINLSGHSLADEEFCQTVLRRLDETAVSPDKICFEITETAAIVNMSRAIRFINIIRAKGCTFALDDFGSGLSSFGYLKNLPVDYLKIDGQFVKDMVEDATDLEMVKSINGIGHAMGKKTIAEFVESGAILHKVRELGVDYAQGYAVGRPRPLDELV